VIQWTPRFLFDDGDLPVGDITLQLPVGLWRHSFPVIGGDIESDGAVPASYIVRRDYCLTVPLRVFEEEWPTIRRMIAHGQQEGVIFWYPNESVNENVEVYLETPAIGDPVEPRPDGEYPACLIIELTFRRVDGQPWDEDFKYFEEAA